MSNNKVIVWNLWRKQNYLILGWLLIGLLLLSTRIYGWSTSNGVPISTANNTQTNPQLVSDGTGGAIFTWEDYRTINKRDIYSQRISSAGTTLWTLNGVTVCNAGNIQQLPQLIPTTPGSAIIAWQDNRLKAKNSNIFSQQLNSNGGILWTLNGSTVCSANSKQITPQITTDGFNGGIIVWDDTRNGTDDIYAQRINSSGITEWTLNGVLICNAFNAQQKPQITSDGAGGAIIVWQDNRSSNLNIYAQRVNDVGSPLWTANGVVICNASNTQQNPQVISDGASGAIITWQDARTGTDDIYVQRVNSSGSTLWTSNGVAICTSNSTQQLPQLVSDGASGAIIVWQDNRNANLDIYAQRVDSSGVTAWTSNGIVICNATNTQQNPKLTSDGFGGAIITWQDRRSGTDDIYVQRINSSGTVLWTSNGIVLCNASNTQQLPQIISNGSNGAIVTWVDNRSGNSDIYAQSINSVGFVSPTVPVANFYAIPTGGIGPFTVNFIDISSNNPNSWNWDFGDGGTSTTQFPNHTYSAVAQATSYSVRLIVSNIYGTSSITQTNYIAVIPPTLPSAGFFGAPLIGVGPYSVNFVDTSANFPTSWNWDFGDGSNDTTQYPIHNYGAVTAQTFYTVKLTISNSNGSSSTSRNNYVQVLPPTLPSAGFFSTPTTGIGPFTAYFIDTSSNYPTSWDWDFGDGFTDNIQYPAHLYDLVTTLTYYDVQLIVSNSFGSSTSLLTNYILVSDTSIGLPSSLSDLPDLKLFTGQALTGAFDLEAFNTGAPGTSYSVLTNFLGLSSLDGSSVNQNLYSSSTTGSNTYRIINSAGQSNGNNKVKYSTYKIQKLPKVGLTPGSSFNINLADYTNSAGGPDIPPSFGNNNCLSSSDSTQVTATWTDSSTLIITASPSFSTDSPVNIDIIASPNANPPYGADIDKERMQVYRNLLPNSTFSTGNDTTALGFENAPNKPVKASIGWVSSATDVFGTQANEVMTITFDTPSSAIKGTPFLANRVFYQQGYWYTARMKVFSPNVNNSHQSLLFNFSNDALSPGGHVDVSGYVLFGTPTVWTWLESPFYSNENGTGFPQFQFKAGAVGTIYVDEIQVIRAAPTLVDSGRYLTRANYSYGKFDFSSDTDGWGREIYTGAGSAPSAVVTNGQLVLDFTGASSGSNQKGIKWTANNNVAGKIYTFPTPVNRQVGARLSLAKQSGNFNTLSAIVLLGVFGVQTSGQGTLGVAPSDLIASAEYGRLSNSIHRTVGWSISPYHQLQLGVKNADSGILRIDDVDVDIDQDDPNYGDGNLFP